MNDLSLKLVVVLLEASLAVPIAIGAADQTPEPSAVQKSDTEALAAAGNAFALELYARLMTAKGNLFFSPYSISSALAMTYAGADGRTAQQMADVLHFALPPQRLHPAFAAINSSLGDPNRQPDGQLTVANALWGQQGYKFLDEFIELNKKFYGAGLNQVDFVSAAEAARQTINTWVEQHTKGRIKDLIQPGALTALTRLVLTNAIYFKGKWASQFDKAETKDEPFILAPDEKISVPMMNQKGDFKYYQQAELQVVELPYKGDALSMVVVLPRKVDGLAEVEKLLTIENLEQWLAAMRRREVVVYLPKFEVTAQFELAGPLAAMGMRDAFSPQAADFSGITGTRELFISNVIHKAFVAVDEEGTEAAAATGVVMRVTAVPAPPVVFRADRPFVFMIRDNHAGSILFMGRVTNPKK